MGEMYKQGMANNLPIGFFDSGVGGLSVYSRFRKMMPYEDTIYFGDLKNMPYGNKSGDELVGFSEKILDFYADKGVKAVVIACNTSSAVAYERVKDRYDFVIYPIIQSCAKVLAGLGYKRLGVFATAATIRSGAYGREIIRYNADVEVTEIACPNWTSYVEAGTIDSYEVGADIKERLDEMSSRNPDKIILGCTHYPYLMGVFEKYMQRDKFIDPAVIFTEYIKMDLSEHGLKTDKNTGGHEEFYVSACPKEFCKSAELFYKVPKEPAVVEL